METNDPSHREEMRRLLAPLFDMEWPVEESKAQKAKELFAKYFNEGFDNLFKDREENSYQHEDFLIKQVASQIDKVLSSLRISPGLKKDASRGEVPSE